MALIICEECNKEFSDKASACPNCGCPNEPITTASYTPNNIECDVEIHGDEHYYSDQKKANKHHWITNTLAWIWYITVIIWIIFSEEKIDGAVIFGGIIIALVGGLVLGLLEMLTPWYKKQKKKREDEDFRIFEVKRYLEKKIAIYNEMQPNFLTIKVCNEEGTDKDKMMFRLYMQAYNSKADAIVINSDNVLTHVRGSVSGSGGSVSGSTASSNSFKIMATLVKYK